MGNSASSKLATVISLMVSRGYVALIFSYLETPPSATTAATVDLSLEGKELARSVIGLCRQLARVDVGAAALLGDQLSANAPTPLKSVLSSNKNIITLISSMQLTVSLPPLTMDFYKDNTGEESQLEDLEFSILPVMELLGTIAAVYPSSALVTGLEQLLVHQWRSLVSDVLTLRLKSLLGLRLLKAVLQLLKVLALHRKKDGRRVGNSKDLIESSRTATDMNRLLILFCKLTFILPCISCYPWLIRVL
jgi:hypothetical protein